MTNYVAFLRGINVGGHKTVPMQKLKKVFESLRLKNVQTLLASGNVVFEAPTTNTAALEQRIEEQLKNTFGHEIDALVRTIEELQHLSESQPFKGIDITPQTRLYVTFLSEKPKSIRKAHYASSYQSFKILHVSEREVCSVLILSPNSRTVDLMDVLEKEFGHKITTRNWNTIVRLLNTH